MELLSARKQVRTPRKELISVIEEKSESDTEESIAYYVNEVGRSAKGTRQCRQTMREVQAVAIS